MEATSWRLIYLSNFLRYALLFSKYNLYTNELGQKTLRNDFQFFGHFFYLFPEKQVCQCRSVCNNLARDRYHQLAWHSGSWISVLLNRDMLVNMLVWHGLAWHKSEIHGWNKYICHLYTIVIIVTSKPLNYTKYYTFCKSIVNVMMGYDDCRHSILWKIRVLKSSCFYLCYTWINLFITSSHEFQMLMFGSVEMATDILMRALILPLFLLLQHNFVLIIVMWHLQNCCLYYWYLHFMFLCNQVVILLELVVHDMYAAYDIF